MYQYLVRKTFYNNYLYVQVKTDILIAVPQLRKINCSNFLDNSLFFMDGDPKLLSYLYG